MPQVYRLEEYNPSLIGVGLIVGEGLCSNIYVIGRKEVTLIDTGVGNRINPIFPQLSELGFKKKDIKQVILTHTHHDHASGTFRILEEVNPIIYVHKDDTKYVRDAFGDLLIEVEDGDIIETEMWPLKVYHTPGHTPGGMCLYNEENKILISGDTVFPDGYYGRYDGESGSLEKIIGSLKRLADLDSEIMLPGHGSPVFSEAKKHVLRSYNQASRPRY
jgi:glyoxylase-like metal-dependent hydrolase (beta-lactamase superfamily II)